MSFQDTKHVVFAAQQRCNTKDEEMIMTYMLRLALHQNQHTPYTPKPILHGHNNEMKNKVRGRTLAMAGLYQCVDLVTQVAWKGNVPSRPFEACLHSLFNAEPESYEGVYGGLPGLQRGLEVLHATLNKQRDTHGADRTRYSIMLIFLEKRLSKNVQEINKIKSGIQAATQQLEHFEMTHVNVISKLADIYRQSISPLGPKIIIRGEQTYLSNPDNASRIRTLLLAGIRAALLWHQAGGNRWRLLFERGAMIKEIDTILAELKTN